MKHKLFIGAIILTAWAAGSYAQRLPDSLLPHAMTYMERSMYKTSSLNELKRLYDSLKTNYDRRYFLAALPGYCTRLQILSPPSWVNTAILDGFGSKDPLCVYNAVNAAGALKTNNSAELMGLYRKVHTTYGCDEDMLKCAVLCALGHIDYANKPAFLTEVLTNDHIPLVSNTFSALIYAMGTAKSVAYSQKLAEYSDSLSSISTKLAPDKNRNNYYKQCKTVKQKIDDLRNNIGGN